MDYIQSGGKTDKEKDSHKRMRSCDFCGIVARSNKQLKCMHCFCVRCYHQSEIFAQRKRKRSDDEETPCPLCPKDVYVPKKKLKLEGVGTDTHAPKTNLKAKSTVKEAICLSDEVLTKNTKKVYEFVTKESKKEQNSSFENKKKGKKTSSTESPVASSADNSKVNGVLNRCSFCSEKVLRPKCMECRVHILCGRCLQQCVMPVGRQRDAIVPCPICSERDSKSRPMAFKKQEEMKNKDDFVEKKKQSKSVKNTRENGFTKEAHKQKTTVKVQVEKSPTTNGPNIKQSHATKILTKSDPGRTKVPSKSPKAVKAQTRCDFCSADILIRRELDCPHMLCGRCLQQCALLAGKSVVDQKTCPLCPGQTKTDEMINKQKKKKVG